MARLSLGRKIVSIVLFLLLFIGGSFADVVSEDSSTDLTLSEEEAQEVTGACSADANCSDNNPCTENLCLNGGCSKLHKAEGTNCGFGLECRQGLCVSVITGKYSSPVPGAEEQPSFDLLFVGLTFVIILILIGYFGYQKLKE